MEMFNKAGEALEHLDLTPRHPVLPGGRSIYGGILFLLYIPLLVLYLFNSIVPLYGPLPSCCACATYETPPDSFIYRGNNATCTKDTACRQSVKSQLQMNCDSAVSYNQPLINTIRMDIALIICAGMVSGAPCNEKCLEVSKKWLGAQDYSYSLNRYQALTRCPSSVGICDFKAVFEAASSDKFPQSICRYPDLTGILTRLGAGLGLVNGILVTVRMLMRAVWIRVTEKKEDDGKGRDYAKGVFYGLIFNYFSVTFFLVSSTTSKRMRYGAQLAIGLIIVFLKTPLVISLVYLLGQFWAPMMVYSAVSILAYLIMFRTLYCILRLETRSREMASRHDEMPYAGAPEGQSQSMTYSKRNLLHKSKRNLLQPAPNYGTLGIEDPDGPFPLYPHSQWRHFLLGLVGNVFTFVYMMKVSWHKRNSGFFAGAMCGVSILLLSAVWAVMYSLRLWPTILFDFPFPVQYPTSAVYFQSLYFTFTTICSLTFVYYLCSFLKALPDQHNSMVSGTKYQYRMSLLLSSLPVTIVFLVFFFAYFLPYTTTPLPDSVKDCSFPLYQVLIPFLGVIPAICVFIFAKVARVRWGAFAACGFSFLALSILLNVFIFQYCLGSSPHRRPFYPLVCASELVGAFIVIFGAIRPNQSRRFYSEPDQEPLVAEPMVQ